MGRPFSLAGKQLVAHPELLESGRRPEEILGTSGPAITGFYELIRPEDTHRASVLRGDEQLAERRGSLIVARTLLAIAMYRTGDSSTTAVYQPNVMSGIDDDMESVFNGLDLALSGASADLQPPIGVRDLRNAFDLLHGDGVRLASAIVTLETEVGAGQSVDVLMVPKVWDELSPGPGAEAYADRVSLNVASIALTNTKLGYYGSLG